MLVNEKPRLCPNSVWQILLPLSKVYQGWTEDFVIEGAQIHSRQWRYGCNSTHQDCEQHTFLGSFRCMLLYENFRDWSSLRCNLVHSGHLNLANAWIQLWTCNAEILNKPQKSRLGPPGPTPKSTLVHKWRGLTPGLLINFQFLLLILICACMQCEIFVKINWPFIDHCRSQVTYIDTFFPMRSSTSTRFAKTLREFRIFLINSSFFHDFF